MERHELDFGAMTSMRFFAAIHVVILHESLDHVPGLHPTLNVLLDRTAAVSLFFFVSGFILTYSYYRRDFSRSVYGAFLASRLARVFPLYLLGFVLWIPFWLARDVPGASVTEVVSTFFLNLFLLQAWVPSLEWFINRPGWTISTFLFFWATLPFMLVRIRRWRSPAVAAMFVAMLVASQVLVWWFEAHYGIQGSRIEVLHKHPLVRWPEFLMGVSLGILFARGLGRHRSWRTPGLLPATGLAAVGLFVFLPQPFDNYIHNGLLMPLLAVVLITSLVARGPTQSALSTKWLVRQGEASFSLYILHLPFANYLSLAVRPFFEESQRFTIHFALFDIALLLILAPLVEKHLEAPWRHRIKDWARQRGVPARGPKRSF